MISRWLVDGATCPTCGAPTVRTRSGVLACSRPVDVCDWHDGPAPSLPVAVPIAPIACRHAALRAANRGACPLGCA